MAHGEDRPAGYRHVGHLRAADGATAAVVAAFVDRLSRPGDRVVVACPESMADVLAGALDVVHVLDPPWFDARPASSIAELVRLVDRETPPDGGRLQLITAVERPACGWARWMQTEALLNHVLADRPVDHLCLLGPDASAADGPGPAEVGLGTHPWTTTDGEPVENPHYREPAGVIAELQRSRVPDPIESTEPALALLDLDDMRTLRRSVSRVLADSALSPDAVQDFVLAIDEIVANAAEHGVPPVDVRLWCTHDRLLCTITDHGACFEDPLAGYGPAHGDMSVGGMGLWLARRSVDDLVAVPAQADGGGCTVRLVVHA